MKQFIQYFVKMLLSTSKHYLYVDCISCWSIPSLQDRVGTFGYFWLSPIISNCSGICWVLALASSFPWQKNLMFGGWCWCWWSSSVWVYIISLIIGPHQPGLDWAGHACLPTNYMQHPFISLHHVHAGQKSKLFLKYTNEFLK